MVASNIQTICCAALPSRCVYILLPWSSRKSWALSYKNSCHCSTLLFCGLATTAVNVLDNIFCRGNGQFALCAKRSVKACSLRNGTLVSISLQRFLCVSYGSRCKTFPSYWSQAKQWNKAVRTTIKFGMNVLFQPFQTFADLLSYFFLSLLLPSWQYLLYVSLDGKSGQYPADLAVYYICR
jgi:hypothetical protein